MSEVSGEFLSGDSMLTHAIEQHRELRKLADEAIEVAANNAKIVHRNYHRGVVAAREWDECSIRTCRDVVELKRKIEEACGIKV